MSTKKNLADVQSETPTAPLRRGRGLRLSRAPKQSSARSPKAEAPPELIAAPPESIEAAAEPLAVDIESDSTIAAPFEPEQPEPVREKRKLKLRKELLKECKRIARAQDRKLYQVIEAALESYIERQGVRE